MVTSEAKADAWTLRIVGGVGALVVLGVVTFWIAGPMLAVSGAKKEAAAQLRDPQSAQFRNVHLSKGHLYVCGEINGKNGYGAYGGFTRFYGDEHSATLDNGDTLRVLPEIPSDAERFERDWKEYCS